MGKASKLKRAALQSTPVEPATAPPLAKFLASNDKATRDRAIKTLAAFLSRPPTDQAAADEPEASSSRGGRGRIPAKEMQKLWKGLFYCFWMSDKPLVQQALASELSNLILLIDPADCEGDSAARTLAALEFVGGFWEAVVREWAGIDRLRLDKYYMLIRRFTNATLKLLARGGWEPESIAAFNAILARKEGGPLTYQDHRLPSSIPYHLSDLYLTELQSVLSSPTDASSVDSAPPPPSPATIPLLLSPFTSLLLHSSSSTVFSRLLANVYSPLLSGVEADRWDGTVLAEKRTQALVLKALFDEAGLESARDGNRRKTFEFWKECGGDAEDDE